MLDFIFELERVLSIWPDNVRWTLLQIAEAAKTPVPHVVEYLSEALNKSLDVHEPMTFHEVNKAHQILLEKKKVEIEAQRQWELAESRRSVEAYDQVMAKVRLYQAQKNWRGAYLSLNYFYGLHKGRLPGPIVVQIADDCLRLGMKAAINFQELSQWLSCSIRTLLKLPNAAAIEDALDILDAYGDHFLKDPRYKGEQILTNIFLALKPSAMEFDLTARLNEVAGELKLNSVMDVVI